MSDLINGAKIVVYIGNEFVEYFVPKKVSKGIMAILDEAISSDASDWMSAKGEQG